MTIQAAIYLRVSTAAQADPDDKTSLPYQEQACRRYCVEHGYAVDDLHVYREIFSGAEQRAELSRMVHAVRNRDVQAIVCLNTDRMGREQNRLGWVFTEADDHGACLEFVEEDFDNSPVGKFMRAAKGFVAEVEREKIRERTTRGRRARIEAGKVPRAGFELYGYRRDNDRGVREVYEPEAQIIRQIFRWIGEDGLAIRAAIRQLNADGIPTPSIGKLVLDRSPRWHNGTFHRILKNPAYKGEPYAWRYRSSHHSRSSEPRPESEWIALPAETTPAIVSSALWDAVQRRLATNRGERTRNVERPFLLRGRVLCSVCDRPMYPVQQWYRWKGTRRHVPYYVCSSRHVATRCGGRMLRADHVEEAAWAHIAGILRDPQTIAREVEQRRANEQADFTDEITTAESQLARLTKQQERLLHQFRESESVPWALVEREIGQAEREKAVIQKRLEELRGQQTAIEMGRAQMERLAVYCERVAENLETMDFEAKREVLDALGAYVVGSGGTGSFLYLGGQSAEDHTSLQHRWDMLPQSRIPLGLLAVP